MKAIADATGIAVIGAALFVIAYFTPEETLNSGMFILFFLGLAVIGAYYWHSKDAPQSTREWATRLAVILLIWAMLVGLGIGFAYINGVRGNAFEMVSSNGTFLLVTVPCPALMLIALGGLLRAKVVEKLQL